VRPRRWERELDGDRNRLKWLESSEITVEVQSAFPENAPVPREEFRSVNHALSVVPAGDHAGEDLLHLMLCRVNR
jgi:hypothetical protein